MAHCVYRPKHPAKYTLVLELANRVPLGIAIFTGFMDANFYMSILDHCLVPFIQANFNSAQHRFM